MTHPELSPATLKDIQRVAREMRPASWSDDPETVITHLVCRVLDREYPQNGPLMDAIQAEARETPHSQAWFKCRDAVTTEAMKLADELREQEATNG